MRLAPVAFLLLATTAAQAGPCDLMLNRDDLPDCVKELSGKMFLLQAQVQALESENRLSQMLICNMALYLTGAAPGSDMASVAHDACDVAMAHAKPKAKSSKK